MSLFHPTQQEKVDRLVEAYRTKALTRRAFMQHAGTIGLSFGSASALLAACGQQPGTTTVAGGAVTLKLIMHVNAPAVQAIQNLNAAFHKQNPTITVNVTTAQTNDYPTLQTTRLTAKDVDIVEVGSFVGAPTSYTSNSQKPSWQQQIDGGNYVDLTGQSFLNSFTPTSLKNTSTYNGKVYSVPSGTAPFTGVFYSKALFQKYNLSVPTVWNELLSVCQTLQGHGVTPFTLGQKDTWPANLPTQALQAALYPDLQAFDEGIWKGTLKYTDPTFVKLLQRVQQLWKYTEQGFGGISYATAPARFVAGKAAMMADGVWTAPALQQVDPNFQFGYFPLPGGDTASDNNFLAGKYDISWAIASSTKNKDAALKWLAFYSEPTNYSEFINADGLVPTQANTQTTPFLQSIAQWTTTMRLSPDQVLHSKTQVSKYADIVPAAGSSLPTPTTYLTPLGTISSATNLAQQMQTDWMAAKF